MLPKLREDLNLFPGPHLRNGMPTWTIHDPVQNRFFRIGWAEYEILSRWPLGSAAAIFKAIQEETTIQIKPHDFEGFVEFLIRYELVAVEDKSAVERLVQTHQRQKSNPLNWLLHHYLFFKIPLFKSDSFLDSLLPRLQIFFTQSFQRASLLAGVLAILLICSQWFTYVSSFILMTHPGGIFSFAAALFFTKIVHEFGHALVAKRLGCKVPTMGFAIVVMMPVLYTDTNEVWRLKNKKDQMSVTLAGLKAELLLAIWASLLWALLPDGFIRQVFFVLSSTAWISSILINLLPFFRFDGYFALSDLTEIENLHQRSAALGTWNLRRFLLGLTDAPPETWGATMRRGLITFAYVTWAYRFSVFLGIAIAVYIFFWKPLGIFLFLVEIGWFIIRPIHSEMKIWRTRWTDVTRKRKILLTSLASTFLIIVLIFHPELTAPALLQSSQQHAIYAPFSGRLDQFNRRIGIQFKPGEQIAQIVSPELDYRKQVLTLQSDRISREMASVSLQQDALDKYRVLMDDLQRVTQELNGVTAQLQKNTLLAPFSGQMVDVNDDLKAGIWVAANEKLGTLIDAQSVFAEAYVSETAIRHLRIGTKGQFYSFAEGQPSIDMEVISIDVGPVQNLHAQSLSTLFGGPIETYRSNTGLVPTGVLFRVTLKQDKNAPLHLTTAQSGMVRFEVGTSSWLAELLRRATGVILRELSF